MFTFDEGFWQQSSVNEPVNGKREFVTVKGKTLKGEINEWVMTAFDLLQEEKRDAQHCFSERCRGMDGPKFTIDYSRRRSVATLKTNFVKKATTTSTTISGKTVGRRMGTLGARLCAAGYMPLRVSPLYEQRRGKRNSISAAMSGILLLLLLLLFLLLLGLIIMLLGRSCSGVLCVSDQTPTLHLLTGRQERCPSRTKGRCNMSCCGNVQCSMSLCSHFDSHSHSHFHFHLHHTITLTFTVALTFTVTLNFTVTLTFAVTFVLILNATIHSVSRSLLPSVFRFEL